MSITILDDDSMVCVPSAEEVEKYATFLGIDLKKEKHLEWIARDGLRAAVPHPWKACTQNGEELFYFNFETGESVWDHPSDEKYRNMVKDYRKRSRARRFSPSPAMELVMENMWAGGIKFHKPTFEEIQSQVIAKCNVRPHVCLIPHQFPGFVQQLMDYVDVTQKDIDDAWLDAALDVLGRPAIRLPSHDDSLGYLSRSGDQNPFGFHTDVSFWEMAQHDDQNMVSLGIGNSTAVPPTFYSDDVDDAFSWIRESFTDVASSSDGSQDDDNFQIPF